MEYLEYDILKEFDNIVACTTKKDYTLPYLGSCAMHTGEDPKDIMINRNSLKAFFPKSASFVLANQVHNDNILDITKKEDINWQDLNPNIKADSLITPLKEVVLTILTADCVPILMYDPNKNIISAIHAGWRGSDKKIAIKTVEYMQNRYGCNPANIVAVIAPSIGKCCYEVDRSVALKFNEYKDSLIKKGDKYMLDLKMVNYTQLLNSGLKKENIEVSSICTSCSSDKFFSYRKESGCSGRFATAIMMK